MSEDSEVEGFELPWQRLEEDTLRRLIEEFLTRQQAEGGGDWPLEEQVRRVRELLRRRQAVILFDPLTESFTLEPRS